MILQVPQIWAKVAYPCLKPLGSWFKDYLRRVSFMRKWLTEGQPSCFWLPGFFFPQGFLTGVLQVHARKYTIPIDTLAFRFSVTSDADASEVYSPLRLLMHDALLMLHDVVIGIVGVYSIDVKVGNLNYVDCVAPTRLKGNTQTFAGACAS